MSSYHYTECGLNNVWVENAAIVVDDADEEAVVIRNVRGLHHAIAESIIFDKGGLSGSELRFIRSEMGMTQAEMGDVLHKEGLTVGRWERGEHPIDPNAETVIRLLAIETLKLQFPTVAEVAAKSVGSAKDRPIKIDGSDPENYRPLAA